jgi:hypothetical protein
MRDGGKLMGVYIRGMEIPKRTVLFCIHPDGKVFADLEGGWREYKAVPAPEHGRLIDADALKEKWTHRNLDLFAQGWGYLQDLNRAPTIIPAEEGE